MGLSSRKLRQFLLMFLTGFTSFNVLILFPHQSPSSLCAVFIVVSSVIDKVPSISLSPNIYTLDTLTFILRTG